MMPALRQLPLALISLLFASAAFSEPTSSNDPFRAVILQIPKQAEPPICCLKPLPPLETAENEILLSFEEWKAKQQSEQQASARVTEREANKRSGHGTTNGNASNDQEGAEQISGSDDGVPAKLFEDVVQGQPAETISPHFRVPVTDRFNYASTDCSARVHTAHRSAKSASSILSSKKDRYMLSPCNPPNGGKKFVVVELCDDIRIDTVQIANFEFFSGVFKDFSVSVSKTYTEGWTDAGTYRAKNIRGVQSFHPPRSLRDFYRYIRIDFHSHYGNEYYCPVSLLRVYGLTHLEEWKWDIWESESKAKQAELGKRKPSALSAQEVTANKPKSRIPDEATSAMPSSVPSNLGTSKGHEPNESVTLAELSKRVTETILSIEHAITSPTSQGTAISGDNSAHQIPDSSSTPSTSPDTSNDPDGRHNLSSEHASHAIVSSPSHPPSTNMPTHSNSASHFDQSEAPSSATSGTPSLSKSPTPESPNHRNSNSSTSRSSTTPSSVSTFTASSPSASAIASSPPSVVVVPIPPLPSTTGGESIYRTIMNRLTALETNHTLYTRYMEQQNSAIRELIKRLGEDIGRLDGITRAQRVTYQRTLNEWEKQRMQMMMEYGQLMSRIENLSEEIVLEKRLGVAQLSLLLAVLVFMGLTRGSRGESIVVNGPVSMREWSKRHLRLSSDWTSRFTRKSRSRSQSATRINPETAKPYSPSKPASVLPWDDGVVFPRGEAATWKKGPLEPINLNTAPLPAEYRTRVKKISNSRPRTPSLRTSAAGKRTPHPAAGITRPATPTAIRSSHLRELGLQRSSSQGAQAGLWPGQGSKSAKKHARTAHLHPVKTPAHPFPHLQHADLSGGSGHNLDRGAAGGVEMKDVFSAPAGSFNFPRLSAERMMPKRNPVRDFREGAEVEAAQLGEELGEEPLMVGRRSAREIRAEDGDGDNNWVDTDSVVGSDIDLDLQSD